MRNNNPSFKRRPQLSTPLRLGVVAVAACFISAPAFSNPVNPTVVNGAATFNQAGSVLTVTNSNGAVINWDKFSIQAGETTHFAQSAASSTVLNRVLNDPTAIYGTLSSNGRVWLVNPAGIMVGPGGRIDTAGFVASTLSVRNEDFLAGRNLFVNDGMAKDVINQGEIKTPAGGSVYLIGSNVSNEGIITTPQGETILAVGNTVSLIDSATPGVKVDITGAEGNATNLGTIAAEAGRIGIAGVIVRNSGTLNASSVVSEGGRIFLKASQDAYVDGNGRIVTTGTKGGSVEVLGSRVAVMDNASIDASATSDGSDGGNIKVGGDYQGKNSDIQNASITYFGADAELKADAGKVGDGGTVIVWADDTTRAYGNISARGGDLGGDGGFVEVSGKSNLTFRATADVRAPGGRAGTVLLDPDDISIVLSDATFTDESLTGSGPFELGSVYGGTVGATIGWNTIQTQLGLGSLSITSQAGGIDFANGSYGWSNSNSLSLYSLGHIVFNGGSLSNSGSGALNMMAGWNYTSGTVAPATTGSTGDIQATSTSISTTSGAMKLTAAGAVTLTNSNVSSGGTLNLTAQSLTINATTGNAGLSSQGNQTIALGAGSNGILNITSTVGNAKISSGGSQVITFNGTANTLTLQGSNSATTYGGNSAEIKASGTQSITKTSGSLAISLTGGSGTASNPQNAYKSGSTLICTSCATFNSARIESDGAQTISATSITVQGGSGGKGNSAQIESKGGTQSITTTGLISITGGTGTGYYNSSVNDSVTSDAGIHSDGTQTVNAGSITLAGGGDSTTLGGAFLTGKTSQSITTTGNLTITGGASGASGQYGLGAAAVIGEETGANITLNVGGTLSMVGGSGASSYALIGSASGSPTVNITAANNITMTGGSSAAKIGVLTNGPAGSLSMTSTTGNISQDAASAINTATMTAQATAGNLQFAGANRVNTVNLTANSSINYNSKQSFHLATATPGAASPLTVTTVSGSPYGGNIYLGSVGVAGATTVDVTAYGAIYDDNGSGVTNVTGNTINLTSYGGTSGSLAISTDVKASTATTATVVAGSSYGGVRIGAATGSAGTYTINDSASAGTSASFFDYSSGPFTLTGSNLTISTGSYGDVFIGATGNLAWNGNRSFTTSGNVLVASGGTLSFGTSNYLSNSGTVKFAAAALDMPSNAQITATKGFTGIIVGNASMDGGSWIRTYDGDLNLVVGGDLTLNGGAYLHGGYSPTTKVPDVTTRVSGNLRLNNGAQIKAYNDIYVDMVGSTSTLYLNDTAGLGSPSKIWSDVGMPVGTTHLAFLSRTSGGVVIDGITGGTTTTSGSGFFTGTDGLVATAGNGLKVTYPVTAALDLCSTDPGLCKPTSTISTPIESPPLTFDLTGSGGANSGNQGNVVGGGEGTFGSEENGGTGGANQNKDEEKDKKDDKDKKSDQAKDEKKDDKPAKKKLAQCST
ncbi:MAG: filamentous hemagglutinin N-terminal domain-containing protein [Sulfuritalea sp.]|nr:filamentous hemagglutinin N-terminal domain-containing protein [Sulfuritalea sp.]